MNNDCLVNVMFVSVADLNEKKVAHANYPIPGWKKKGNAARSSRFRICCSSAAMLWIFAFGVVASAQQAPGPRSQERLRPRIENFYVIKARRDAEFEALRRLRRDQSLEEEGTGYGRYQEWVGYWQQKLFPHGDFRIAYNAMNRIVREPNASRQSPKADSCSGWTELGPFDMPLGTDPQRGVGQVDWIALDPADANNVFTGSPKGGLFYSTNGGATWQSGGTDFLLPNIGAAHVAVDPTDSNRWFLATGDGDGLDDGTHNNDWNISHGVYRTPDKGLTWEKIGLDFSITNWWYFQIKKLVIAPDDHNVIYAATSIGLYRTANALASNPALVTWQLLPTGGNNQNPFYDIDYQPGSTSTIYASGRTILRSTDSGQTWIALPGIPFLPDPNVVRISMEVTAANPNFLYVVVVAKDPAACNGTSWTDSGGIVHPIPSSRLYRFDAANGGGWTDKGPICETGSYGPDQRGVHSSRAHSIGVSPINARLIYLGDVKPVVKCTTGDDNNFCNWTETENTVHDDIHQVKFTPDGLTIYAASDGGVFKTVNGGSTWTPQNNGLRVATSLRMSTSATDPALIMNGLFDDGTVLYQNGTWRHVLGGDGLTPIIDHTDPNYMYASSQGGFMLRSDNKGITWLNYIGLPCSNWWTYAVLNSVDTKTVFGSCMPEVVRSTTGGGSWSAISQFASNGMSNYQVWKIYTAPSDRNYLYANLVSGTPELLMRTTNANEPNPANVEWQAIPHPSEQWISDIDVDETDPNKFWLTYGGFQPATEKIYYYDANLPPLQRWQNLTTNLANMSVNSIVHERGSDRLFIGTHLGVYSGNGSTPNWSRVGGTTAGDLPHDEVNDVEINYVNNKLRAGTFGRGTWEISLDPCLPTVAGPDAIIKDSAADVGNQPNNESGTVLWASDDIWVRNAPDHEFTYSPIPPRYSHEHQHENPEFSPLPINTPYVYVKVHNRGDHLVSGKVHVYWANASTGLDWQLPDWTEIIPMSSSTTDVVDLAPGSVWVASLQWTNIPNPQLSVGGHFCLVARFVADSSTPDPIVGEATGNGIWGNVRNSNNIAWKNVTIVDSFQNRVGGQVIVRNISHVPSRMRLGFDLAPGSEAFLRFGRIEVDLGKKLFAIWQRAGKKGKGVKAIGPTTIAIQQPHAYIEGLTLSPREEHVVMIRFPLHVAHPKQREFTLHVTQFDLAKESRVLSVVNGGESFVIRATPQ